MAAFSSTTVWEFRDVGNVLNGAAWDAGIAGAGTDYSQQNVAQLTVTDLVGNSSNTLTSVTGGFTSQMIGNAICYFEGGNVHHRMIDAVTNTNTITVTEATTTFTGITGRVGGAGSVTNQGFPQTKFTDGQKGWMKGLFTPVSNAPTLSGVFGRKNPFVLEGYQNVRGDNGQATIQSGSLNCLVLSGDHIICKNVTLDSTTAITPSLAVSGNKNHIINCVAVNGADNWGFFVSGDNNLCDRCIIDFSAGTQHQGIPIVASGNNNNFNHCIMRGSSNNVGISCDHNTVLDHCIVDNNATAGVQMWTTSNFGFTVKNCNIVNNGTHGLLNLSTAAGIANLTVVGCIFGDNGGYDIKYDEADISANKGAEGWKAVSLLGNCFYNVGSGRYGNIPSGFNTQEVLLGGDPFVDALNGDYNLDTAGYGADVRDGALTIDFPDNINTGTYVAGAIGLAGGNVPPTDPSGLVATVISSTRIDLVWVDNAADEIYYVLERNNNGAGFVSLALIPPDTTAYSDTTVQANTNYVYRIKAVN